MSSSYKSADGNGEEDPRSSSQKKIVRSSTMQPISACDDIEKNENKSFNGRRKVWPGVLIFFLVLCAVIFLIVFFATKKKENVKSNASEKDLKIYKESEILGGKNKNLKIDVASDGKVGNPKVYANQGCQLPNYVSKNNRIYAEYGGNSIPLSIKGVNWFGMESSQAIPMGIWSNGVDGTTVYALALWLAENNFNSVRLPLAVEHILKNAKPNKTMFNSYKNRAIDIKNYMSLLQSLIKALAHRGISVLLDFHRIDPLEGKSGLWYTANIPEVQVLEAVDILTDGLCSSTYWNVIGLDVSNEPHEATWGSGGDDLDFRVGATKIANRMLKGCKNWLAMIEGVNSMHSVQVNGQVLEYYDWWGGGLQKAASHPISLTSRDKIVWAPHYYSPSVNPVAYMYKDGNKELDDKTLRDHVEATTKDMFGFLAEKSTYAIVLGEFGGLYGSDKHPMKTSKRVVDYTAQIISRDGYSGGYVWSLNPESLYEYNPADKKGDYTEGLLQASWLKTNEAYVKALSPMDKMRDLRSFPCFKK